MPEQRPLQEVVGLLREIREQLAERNAIARRQEESHRQLKHLVVGLIVLILSFLLLGLAVPAISGLLGAD